MNNIEYLPNDIMNMIMDIRREEMKKDKQIKESKAQYDFLVAGFKESVYSLKDDILRDKYGTKGLYGEVMDEAECCEKEDCERVLDKWELWEIDFPILSTAEDNEPFNWLNDF